ncbi:response regulator transcription factor [Rheinheimera sp.]|uniref:response regulator transcription factor n=1 Tax=Rheinheimera sp. TaxID=1869214 RepID=UPI002FDE8C58
MSQKIRVLLLEDDAGMQSFLATLLASQGYLPDICASGQQGLQLLAQQDYALLLLDLGLPDLDGLQLLTQLRLWSAIPVIIISARGKEQDKVQALDLGANDYVTKPFSAGELLARMRSALRPRQGTVRQWQFGTVELDPVQHTVTKAGERVHLTKTEYELLLCLLRHAGVVQTHNQILQQVWGEAYQGRPEYVRVHMAQLRQKLEDNPAAPRYLTTEAGVGYRLCL